MTVKISFYSTTSTIWTVSLVMVIELAISMCAFSLAGSNPFLHLKSRYVWTIKLITLLLIKKKESEERLLLLFTGLDQWDTCTLRALSNHLPWSTVTRTHECLLNSFWEICHILTDEYSIIWLLMTCLAVMGITNCLLYVPSQDITFNVK